VAGALFVCGGLLVWQATHGGYRDMEEPSGAPQGDWAAVAWVVAGVLANAALITTLGFVLSCALCFGLAVRGLRLAEGRPGGSPLQSLRDVGIGLAIAAPVYWLFRVLLAVNLPSLTGTSWI
jgi:putative tricarboxylic transport membrane protein